MTVSWWNPFPMKPFRTHASYYFASLTGRGFRKPSTFITDVDSQMIKTGFDPTTYHSNHTMEALLKRGELSQARQLFDKMPHKNTFSTNTLISGYVKAGNFHEAKELFGRTIDRTMVTWTIMIGGYSQSNQTREAFALFSEMQRSGTEPDHVTFASLLSACNDIETSNQGIRRMGSLSKL